MGALMVVAVYDSARVNAIDPDLRFEPPEI
jgi:hypothetical protein